MKKILLSGLAALMAVSASAQFTSGGTATPEPQTQHGSLADQMRGSNGKSFSAPSQDNYGGRFNFGYNMWSTMPDNGDGISYNGIYLEWLAAIKLNQSLPLYFDIAINYSYNFKGEDKDLNLKSASMMQLAVPLQVEYRLPVGDKLHISPYLGLVARANLLADQKIKIPTFNNRTGKQTGSTEKSINLFDKDDVGNSELTWKRFQLGWNIGVNFDINKFTIGLSYGTDFMEIAKKCKSSTFKVGIGINY